MRSSMCWLGWRVCWALLLAGLCGAASALSPGQADHFGGGSLEGWGSGAANPVPPVAMAGGGPAGAADGFLQLGATGVAGAGGKLVGIAGTQWLGDYEAAGITGLAMAVNNLGVTDLSLRLWLLTPQGSAVSAQAVNLPVGSGWQPALFSLLPGALAWQGAPSLANVVELRLFHGSAPAFPGQNIAAQLGVDNVTAVPEPASALLLPAGLVVLAGAAGRRRRRARGSG